MPRSWRCQICLLFLLALPLGGSRAQEPAGGLRVVASSPRGELKGRDEAREIYVCFDRPMVPLTEAARQEVKENQKDLFRIFPAVKGKLLWLGTSLLKFIPADTLPYSTRYRVKIPRGVTALDGAKLKDDYWFEFETPRPRLLRSYPKPEQRWVPLDVHIGLAFNQPMDPHRAKRHIRLTWGEERKKVPFKLRHPNPEEFHGPLRNVVRGRRDRVLVLLPQELKRGKHYQVHLLKGLRGKDGELGMKGYESFGFYTVEEFRLKGVEKVELEKGFRLIFSNPVSRREVLEKLHIEPSVELTRRRYWRGFETKVWVPAPLKPESEYRVIFPSTLVDRDSTFLTGDTSLVFHTGPYPPKFRIREGYGLVEAYGDRKVPLRSINLDSVHIQLEQIDPDSLVPFMEIAYRQGYEGPYRVDRFLPIKGKRNLSMVTPVELDGLLGPKGKGVVFLRVSSDQVEEPRKRVQKALYQVTGLAITAKFSPDNTVAWVTSLRNGKPIAGATVEARSSQNKVLWRGKTDELGSVEGPGWGEFGLKDRRGLGHPLQYLFCYHKGDFGFTRSDWGTGISPYRFGIRYDWHPQVRKREGTIFTERGIYRAGETVHFKGIIRDRRGGDWSFPDLDSVMVSVRDPMREEIFKRVLPLQGTGSFFADLPLPPAAHSGWYSLQAYERGRKGKPLVEGNFRVEAYRPAEFLVEVHPQEDEYIFGDQYRATISANYLFGAPMGHVPISWKLRLTHKRFSPPGWEGYRFGTPKGRESRLLASGEDSLDEEGNLQVSVPIEPDEVSQSASLLLEAEVTGITRQTAAGRASVIVHRGEFYIGISPKSTFVEEGEGLPVKLIVVKPDGTPLSGVNLDCKLVRREWHSVRKVGLGGRTFWVSSEAESTQAQFGLKSQEGPLKRVLKPKGAGSYRFIVQAKDGRGNRVVSTIWFWVAGKGYAAWKRRDDDRIELLSDQKRYKVGDQAKILIKSPYEEATALISLEREGIIRHWTELVVGSAPTISIPIVEDCIPNVFVSVILLEGRRGFTDGEDVGRPSFKIGYIELPVDPESRSLTVEVETDKREYRPGEEVRMRYWVKDFRGRPRQAEVAVAVVDEGVLALTAFPTPNPFDFFYRHRPLSVLTSEPLIHLIEQRNYGEKGEDLGGAGGIEALAGVELRKNFIYCAYWNPLLETDSQGRGEVKFRLPDNLTRFRVMVIAQTTDSKFGAGETHLKVKKPLLLRPSLPRFLRVGDRIEAGVVAQNFTGRDAPILLRAEAEGVSLGERRTAQFLLAQGGGKEVRFDYAAKVLGQASFRFQAASGEERDGVEVKVPIKEPEVWESVAIYKPTDEGATEGIVVPEERVEGLGDLTVSLSSTALSQLGGAVKYLFEYPYGCLEQRTSRVLPMITAGDLVEAFDLPALKGVNFHSLVEEWLKEVPLFQAPNGGFTYWKDSAHPSPYLTAYVLYALIQAKRHGYQVEERVLRRAASWLRGVMERRGVAKDLYSPGAWRCFNGFALYDLALLGRPLPPLLARMYADRFTLPILAKAYMLRAVHFEGGHGEMEENLREELLSLIRISPTAAHFEEPDDFGFARIYHSNLRTTALALEALLETGEVPLSEKVVRWLIAERGKRDHWGTTQENFYALSALAAYFRRYEGEEPHFQAQVRAAGRLLLDHLFQGRSLESLRKEIALESLPKRQTVPLRIEKKGKGILYYGLRLTYCPKEPLPWIDRGFNIEKSIRLAEPPPGGGEMGDQLLWTSRQGEVRPTPVGSVVEVRLRISTPQERSFVVVDDPLPAGYEPILGSLVTESRERGRGRLRRPRRMGGNYWGTGFDHVESLDDRVLLFATTLRAGVWEYRYLARAITRGSFRLPSTRAEEMYRPEVFGRAKGGRVHVE